MKRFESRLIFGVLVALLVMTGCNINSSVEIADGARHDGDANTINGSVRIGDDAVVQGDVGNVNGSIRIGSDATVGEVFNVNGSIGIGSGSSSRSVESVNGSIALSDDVAVDGDVATVNGNINGGLSVQIDGEIETVNGTVSMNTGSQVAEGISTANGRIRLTGTRAASLTTLNGSIDLRDGTRIDGQIMVKEGSNSSSGRPEIHIGQNVEVAGPLIFEKDVDLYIHESARVGEIQGAEARPYSEREDD